MIIPTEFSGFVRDVARRAVDSLADRVKDVDAPFRPIIRAWIKLTDLQKDQLVDELIASVQSAAPEPKRATKKRATKKKKAPSS